MRQPSSPAGFSAFAIKHGFSQPFAVSTNGHAEHFKWQEDRCGLYIWLASNGDVYLGQSVNVRRRLIEHQKNHLDLRVAAFRSVAKLDLDREEVRLARLFEAVGPIRNIKLVARTFAVVRYDLAIADGLTAPRAMPEQETKAAKNWRLFYRHPQAAQVIGHVRHFTEHGLPHVWTTEARFWSATAFRDGGVRINCGQQELFTCTPLPDNTMQIRLLCDRSLDWRLKSRIYRTQSWEHHWSPRKLMTFKDWDKVQAFAEFLMRHTTALNSANHCPQLFRNPLS